MLSIQNLQLFAPKNKDVLLQIEQLKLPSTGIILLLGKNGSGKTTLLKSFCGLHLGFTGNLYWKGKQLKNQSFMERKGIVQYASDPSPLPEFLSLEEYIQLGEVPDQERMSEIMTKLKITNLAEQNVANMSKGQQQKAMLAKAFFSKAELLLLDEPNNFLDYNSEKNLWEMLKKEAKYRLIIATIHQPKTAIAVSDKVYILHEKVLKKMPSNFAEIENWI